MRSKHPASKSPPELTAPPRVWRPGVLEALSHRPKRAHGSWSWVLPNLTLVSLSGCSPSYTFLVSWIWVGVGAESDSDVTEGPRQAPIPRERVDWALGFYVSSGAPPSVGARFSEVVLPRVGCRNTLRFTCLSLPSSWPDSMGVTW